MSVFETLLKRDGTLVYKTSGVSMLPMLRQNRDLVVIRAPVFRPRRYDVVLYRRGDRYILHRVLKVLPEGYVIAGDHNTFLERDVTDDMILGVMTRVIRNGRSVTMDDPKYRLYVHLWCDLWPVRMAILKIKAIPRGIYRRIKKLFKGN